MFIGKMVNPDKTTPVGDTSKCRQREIRKPGTAMSVDHISDGR
jgi:hypothetical protein